MATRLDERTTARPGPTPARPDRWRWVNPASIIVLFLVVGAPLTAVGSHLDSVQRNDAAVLPAEQLGDDPGDRGRAAVQPGRLDHRRRGLHPSRRRPGRPGRPDRDRARRAATELHYGHCARQPAGRTHPLRRRSGGGNRHPAARHRHRPDLLRCGPAARRHARRARPAHGSRRAGGGEHRPARGVRADQRDAAARHVGRGAADPGRGLPQPGAALRGAGGRLDRRCNWPTARPTCSAGPACSPSPGRCRASSTSSCSAPAPTTPCCWSRATARSCAASRTGTPRCGPPCARPRHRWRRVAATVILGLLCLLVSDLPATRGLGPDRGAGHPLRVGLHAGAAAVPVAAARPGGVLAVAGYDTGPGRRGQAGRHGDAGLVPGRRSGRAPPAPGLGAQHRSPWSSSASG